eukprot:TRINITY_DN7489_c0_g1_i1.p1 TRINITY_DN7489_c0_g1~~TRINITY_DN7489_c0_g1_i1.p1  ORF type:complete len:878 (+),score=169.01 TRINITY_DN7489_c0_g1_i1:227-2635(+)
MAQNVHSLLQQIENKESLSSDTIESYNTAVTKMNASFSLLDKIKESLNYDLHQLSSIVGENSSPTKQTEKRPRGFSLTRKSPKAKEKKLSETESHSSSSIPEIGISPRKREMRRGKTETGLTTTKKRAKTQKNNEQAANPLSASQPMKTDKLERPDEDPSKPITLVRIPSIDLNFTSSFDTDTTLITIKQELMKMLTETDSTLNNDINSYYISVQGIRVLDEKAKLSAVLPSDYRTVIELSRNPEFDINLVDSPLSKPIVILNNNTDVNLVLQKLVKNCLSDQEIARSTEINLFVNDEKLDKSQSFFSLGLRSKDALELVLTVQDSNQIKKKLSIIYSPFDELDKKKELVSMKGYLKKQGGSKGGNKSSWLKRWFELYNNQLAYYVDDKARVLKGVVKMVNFVNAEDITEKRKDQNDGYYFSITTSDRTVTMRTKDKVELNQWIENLRQYANLIRLEQSYGINVLTPDEYIDKGGKVKKNLEEDTISTPFMAKKTFSVNQDWQWNSDQNPVEVFEFIEELGVGACAKVVKAAHKQMENLIVAIKIVTQSDKFFQEALEKEIEVLKKCRSPNVIAYYGTVLLGNETWILMDYCGIGSVKDVMKVTQEGLNEPQTKYIVYHTLKGLAHMHAMNILHLDIKAANILLTEQGNVKLADFGVSVVLKTDEMTKEQKDFVGSPLFMAPEIIKKEGYNSRADIWSLGITIIEMVQTRPPNTDITTIQQLPELAERPPPSFSKPKAYSNEFNQFLKNCLVKSPTDRPSAVDLLLDPFMTNVSGPEILKDIIYEVKSMLGSIRKKIPKKEL